MDSKTLCAITFETYHELNGKQNIARKPSIFVKYFNRVWEAPSAVSPCGKCDSNSLVLKGDLCPRVHRIICWSDDDDDECDGYKDYQQH